MDRFTLRFDPALIPELARRYNYMDDSVIENEIGPRAKEQGYFTKTDFIELCRWKTPRSQSRVKSNPAKLIEDATRIALSSPFEEMRIGVLTLLHGVKEPTASVILHFAHSSPYPIIDYRALWSLGIENNRQDYTLDFWLAYTKHCRMLADQHSVSMRTLDRALWQYSKENQPT